MSAHVELMTEKYLKAAQGNLEQEGDSELGAPESTESAHATSRGQTNLSLNTVLSRGFQVMLALVAIGWVFCNRDSLSGLFQPGSPERSANALLWMTGADHKFEDTKLGRATGHGKPFEIKLPDPVKVDSISKTYPGMFGKQEHDDWYKALPSESD